MRIDQYPLYQSETIQVNEVLGDLWIADDTHWVDKETFILSSVGSDAIKLLNGGDNWIVHDRVEDNAIIYESDGLMQVASKSLFSICAKFSPVPRIG